MSEPLGPGDERDVSDVHGRRRGSPSTTVGTIVIVLLSAAAIFAAGLSLGGRTDGRDADERAALEAFLEAYRVISGDFVGESEPRELVEGAIRGMFDTLDDPYSAYMSPDEYDSTLSGISGEFEGIGARMTTEDEAGEACEPIGAGCQLRVADVLDDTPAQAAGLMEDDIVRSVDDLSLDDLTIDDAVRLIRGPRGSDVVLTLLRAGEELPLVITRGVIRVEDVRAEVLADGRVGYLRIDSFSGNSDEDFREALTAQLDVGVRRFVIDVREDPGGFVDAAISISSEFIDAGPVLWEEDASGAQRSLDVISGGVATDPDVELVVLVDDGTASASEIVAGALRDAGRARLVGERTFGKGTVQEWTQLPGENGGFRLSVAKWLTRDKTWVHREGLLPDVEVPSSGSHFRPGNGVEVQDDAQLSRAIELLLDESPGAA